MGGENRLCAALSAIALLCAGTPPLWAQVAYVADAQLDVVSAIDPATATITATIPVGSGLRPCGIALSPDGTTAYVANPSSDTVSVIELSTLTASSIHLSCPPGGCFPQRVIVSPDGRLLYVISENFVNVSITEIDARAHVVTRTFALASSGVSGGCGVATITPDGRDLYVRVPGNPFALAVVDTTTGIEVARLEDGPFYDAVALPNGDEVLAPGAGRIAVVSTETQQVVRVIPIDGDSGSIVLTSDGKTAYVLSAVGLMVVGIAAGSVEATIPLGERISVSDMAISPDDERVLVAELRSQSIIVVDTTTRSVAGAIALGHRPQDLVVSPDSATVWVTSSDTDLRGGTLSQVDLRTGTVSRLFPAADPAAVVAAPDGTLLFVANFWGGEVVVVDTRLNRSVARVSVASPNSIAVDPDGQRVFVGTGEAGTVAVIDTATMAVSDSIPLGGPVRALAVAPDGQRLYVATWIDPFTSSVVVIDARTMLPVATIPVSEPIADLLAAPDGRILYAAAFKYYLNDITGGVVVIDLQAGGTAAMIATGGVSDLAISPDGSVLYAATVFYDLFDDRSSLVSVIDTEKRIIRDTLEVDRIGALAIDPAGDILYAASRGRPGQIAIIDASSLEISATVQGGVSPSDIAVVGRPADRFCAGDCNADGTVTIAELIRGINVLLGGAAVASCSAIDADSDHRVTIADVVRAVEQALSGCSDVSGPGRPGSR